MRPRVSHVLRGCSGDDGFIVVAGLWILAALATLATIFSMYVINTATAFAVHDERLQAEALARAAIELSVYQVAASTPAPLSRGNFAFRIGNANVNAEFMAETARIDLNAAPQVVAALPGMDAERLHAVLVQREAGPQNAQGLLAMLGAAQTLANTQSSKALRVTARIAFDSGQRMTTEAVIFILDSGTEPYRVLTWRDDMDDTPGMRTAA